MEIADGLFRVECRIGETKPLYQHWLSGSWNLWIDAGIDSTPDACLFPAIERDNAASRAFGADVGQLLLVTHADVDHFGGGARMQARIPSLIIASHSADARWIENREAILEERYAMHRASGIDLPAERRGQLLERGGAEARVALLLEGTEELRLGTAGTWRILPAAGHSPGHIILWNAAAATAVIGDAALGQGLLDVDGRLAAPPPYYEVDRYLETIDRIAALRPQTLLTAHFPLMRGTAIDDFLRASRETVRAIDRALTAALGSPGSRSRTLRELCTAVSEELGLWPHDAALALADPLSAHLALRVREGSVRKRGGGTTGGAAAAERSTAGAGVPTYEVC